jgi:branched-subunit amino acid aminotransferase/4-amino-4-deoxychorismate lyase
MDELNRGFKYGDGIFETIKILDSKAVNLEPHLNRLKLSAQKLMLDFNLVSQSGIEAFLQEQKACDGVLKIYLYRHCQSLGYLPLSPQDCRHIYCYTSGFGEPVRGRQKVCVSSVLRCKSIVGSKTLSSLNFVMARLEAQQNNCFDALMLNEEGLVCEFSSANIFVLTKDGLLKTPPANGYIVEGTMREYLINTITKGTLGQGDHAFRGLESQALAVLQDIKCVHQCGLTLQDVKGASKIFYTNAIRGVNEVCL